jgi:hypothetical protein
VIAEKEVDLHLKCDLLDSRIASKLFIYFFSVNKFYDNLFSASTVRIRGETEGRTERF